MRTVLPHSEAVGIAFHVNQLAPVQMMYLVDDVESAVSQIACERAAVGAASPESGPIANAAINVGFDIDHPQVLSDEKAVCGSDLVLAQAGVKIFAIASRMPDTRPIASRAAGAGFAVH